MHVTLLKVKIHRATVTGADLHYEGSCAIDTDLLTQAEILPNERIELYNLENGERLATYAIEAPAGSGTVMLNGAAARKAMPGDRVIICAYANFAPDEAQTYRPTVVFVDGQNRPTLTDRAPVKAETDG